jgi:hypothetical protein
MGPLYRASLNHRTMGKVQKTIGSQHYTQSSEPFWIHLILFKKNKWCLFWVQNKLRKINYRAIYRVTGRYSKNYTCGSNFLVTGTPYTQSVTVSADPLTRTISFPGPTDTTKYGFHWPNFTKTHNHSIQFCEHLPYRMLSTWQEKCWQYGENIIYDLKESAAVTATDRGEHKTEQRHHVGTSGTALTPSVE